MKTAVALVGRRLPDNENLGIGYLQAALGKAGIGCQRLVLNDVREIGTVADSIARSGASIVGLSLPDGGSAIAPLALGEALRARGFQGHITCGGPFATLARDWLLQRYSWIDSVVRFAGEVPLVQLVRALEQGASVSNVAGITTRAGDGGPAPVCEVPMQLAPRHDEMPSILGWKAAHVLATRGCAGRCLYCGPAALQLQELGEGRSAGKSLADLRALGVGGVRRRSLSSLAEEMAALYHERAARYFYFVDEHLLPYGEAEAIEWIDGLSAELQGRKVGKLGIGTMLRADRLTPAIVEHVARAGVIRVFLGVEFGSDDVARSYGRKAPREHTRAILQSLRDNDVAVVSNLMMVHPWATVDSVEQDIEFLASAPAGVFEATRMMPYHGTRLVERLAAEGRLEGNPLRYGYRFDDPAMGRFADIFTRLRAESFWDHSIAYRTHDVWLAARLVKQLRAERLTAGVFEELEEIRLRVNALYAESFRTALALAQHGCGAWEAGELVRSARDQSLGLLRKLERCVGTIHRSVGCETPFFSPLRAAAASALVFTVIGASSPACGGKTEVGSEQTPQSDAATDVEAGKDSAPPVDAKPDVPVSCTPAELAAERAGVTQAVQQAVPCFNGGVQYVNGKATASFSLGYNGMATFHPCAGPSNQARIEAWNAAAQTAVDGAYAPCLLKLASDFIPISGGAEAENQQMGNAVAASCPNLGYSQIVIVVDANGKVTDVKPADGASVDPQILQCVKNSLAGLTFPCYAGLTVCPEYAIAE
ncbi:MAG: B12-binding domain-containing radical SAM protein [Deltaproteobacteria bacterium]|nr:B12-binding domain-containing radical SAM protein [Deltaproteobacteria bacterium]